jgi:hypothetical protein
MKLEKTLFTESVGLEAGRVRIVSARYFAFRGKPDATGAAKKLAIMAELGMQPLGEDGEAVGEPEHKRYMITTERDDGTMDWYPSPNDEDIAVVPETGEFGVGAEGPFLVMGKPDATLPKIFGFYKLYDNLDKLLPGGLPNDIRELVGLVGDIETIKEKDSKGALNKAGTGPREYSTQVFSQIEQKKAAGKAPAKAAAAAAKPAAGKAAPVGRVAAKPAPAAEPEAPADESGEKTPVENAQEVASVFVNKQKSGSTIAISKMKGMIKMDFAKYKGADKEEVNAILSDDSQLATLGGEDFMNAFTVSEDGKTVTFN